MKRIILTAFLMVVMNHLYAYTTVTVKDSISTNTTWNNKQQYLIQGTVYVTSGATLTIDSGVIIKGDKNTKGTLIVERGAKIYANGTATAPIVFTSNQPMGQRSYGDWGGLVICGSAPTNWNAGQAQVEGGPRSFYGGTNANDNSGKLSYVRIEFGGIALSPNNEINGLTLCGVGDATQIDHVQISYGGDDGFEWFGGTVNGKYLISYRTWDDDFDNDVMYSGKNQFLFSLRDPFAADVSGSKSFESDSYLSGTATGIGDPSKATKAIYSNVTAVGPLVSPTSTAFDPQFVAGVHIRRGSAMSVLNSVIVGFPCGLLIDESSASYGSTVANITSGLLEFRNNIIAGIPTNATPNPKEIVYVKDGARNLTPTAANADTTTGNPFNPFPGPISFLKNGAFGNFMYATQQNGVRLQSPYDLGNPNPVPTSTSPIAYNGKALPSYMPAGVYPFDPNKAINTDTSNLFANYNAPAVVPDFTNSKANDGFFTKVNYVGAFSGTQTDKDNWMKGWANFNPLWENYDFVNTSVANVASDVTETTVYPNPASNSATVTFTVANTSDVRVALYDVTGKEVKKVFEGKNVKGAQSLNIDLGNLKSGFYFVSIVTGNGQKSIKLCVNN
jgi:hypothetical protein